MEQRLQAILLVVAAYPLKVAGCPVVLWKDMGTSGGVAV